MEVLTKEEVAEVAGKMGEGEGVRVVRHEAEERSAEAQGYLGRHLTLRLELAQGGRRSRRRAFLKTYEVEENSEDFLGETGIFQREQDFYGIVVESAKEFFGEPDWCPRFLFAKQRVLVLEDLAEGGFAMAEKGQGRGQGQWALDEAHLETTLEALASMHATSIALERKKGQSLPAAYPTVFGKEVLYDESKPESPTRKWIFWQIQDLLEGVNYLDKYSHSEKMTIKNNLEKQILRIYTLSKPSEKYRNVLTHGDVWKNNLLFRYSAEKRPIVCKLVDFQFTRYAPPAHDVMHLLHYATTKEARDGAEGRCLEFYYEKLRERGEERGAAVEEELPREEFLESCKEYKELALVQSLLSLHYILGPVTLKLETRSYEKYGEHLDNHRKEYVNKFFQDVLYVAKITDLFQELIDGYIIKK